jgi:hypothetical protein
MDAELGAKPRDLLSSTKLAALPGFGGGQGDEGQSLDAIWSPDGKAVVFSASTNRDELARQRPTRKSTACPWPAAKPAADRRQAQLRQPEIQRRRQDPVHADRSRRRRQSLRRQPPRQPGMAGDQPDAERS